MNTITAATLHAGSNHTGPVYFDTGALPYAAAVEGKLLKGKTGYVRSFKTEAAALRAIAKGAALEDVK